MRRVISLLMLMATLTLAAVPVSDETAGRECAAFWQGWLIGAARADGHRVHSAQARWYADEVIIDLRCRGSLGSRPDDVRMTLRDLVAYVCYASDAEPVVTAMRERGWRLVITAAGSRGAKATLILTADEIAALAGASLF